MHDQQGRNIATAALIKTDDPDEVVVYENGYLDHRFGRGAWRRVGGDLRIGANGRRYKFVTVEIRQGATTIWFDVDAAFGASSWARLIGC
jgi:hypothetical protein